MRPLALFIKAQINAANHCWLVLALPGVLLLASPVASAQTQLQGDEKLACEALLCLAASAGQPVECAPSLQRYFSISFRLFSDTLRGRLNFLNLCPIVSSDMSSLKNAIINGAGRCDAASLNQESYVGGDDASPGYVSNQMPSYCTNLYSGAYAQSHSSPKYLGEPQSGGHWVEAKDFNAAQPYTQPLEGLTP
jgi:hypothetical protein